jgi:phosphatidylglycerol:prolipoprotein diacylglycerol transferase
MHPIVFEIGPLTVYSYGLMVAVGILAAFWLTEKRGKTLGLDVSSLDVMTIVVCVTGFVCSKLLYWLTRLPDIFEDPSILWNLSDGWVVYGGIAGGLLGGWLFCRKKGFSFLEYFDLLIPGVALAQGFGRIGCFLAGCCYGAETHAWFGVVFPEGSLAPSGVSLIPTQLFSAAFDFALCAFLLWMGKRKKFNGELGAWYLILYSIGRFIIEFWRNDAVRGAVGVLSTSQFISLFAAAAGVAIIIWKRKKTV